MIELLCFLIAALVVTIVYTGHQISRLEQRLGTVVTGQDWVLMITTLAVQFQRNTDAIVGALERIGMVYDEVRGWDHPRDLRPAIEAIATNLDQLVQRLDSMPNVASSDGLVVDYGLIATGETTHQAVQRILNEVAGAKRVGARRSETSKMIMDDIRKKKAEWKASRAEAELAPETGE